MFGSGVSSSAGVPSGVSETTERGGVGVTVPPPINAVGSGVPNANAVKSGEGVRVGNGVAVCSIKTRVAETQPSSPSGIKMLNQLPSAFWPSISTPVPGFSARKAL